MRFTIEELPSPFRIVLALAYHDCNASGIIFLLVCMPWFVTLLLIHLIVTDFDIFEPFITGYGDFRTDLHIFSLQIWLDWLQGESNELMMMMMCKSIQKITNCRNLNLVFF